MQSKDHIEIDCSSDKVWNAISDFHDLSWAPNVITSVDVVGEKKGYEVGAKRILNGVFHETLVAIDSDKLSFSYSIEDGPGPLSEDKLNSYVGTVQLSASGDATLVEWSREFKSSNDNDVAEFCTPIYQALLSDMKKSLS